jgi:N-acetylglucosaminyldiphosphoundecaprenol N-acetyl-beta-D-mannosaminyltransferase
MACNKRGGEKMATIIRLPDTTDDKKAQETFKQVFIPYFNVPISACTQQELFSFIVDARSRSQKSLIDHLNLDNLWLAQENEAYRKILTHLSSVNLVDGMPIRWLASMAGVKVPQRLALTDVVPALMGLAMEKEYTVFILGSNSNTLSLAKKKLYEKQMMPHTVACWTEPRSKLEKPEKNEEALRMIHQVQPDILFVAMGAPWQTLWIAKNWDALPNCTIIPVGGAFDYIAGVVGRAPGWMQKTGLEWTYRLLFDRQKRERSLFKRYILTDVPFAMRLAMEIKLKPATKHHRHYSQMESQT